MGDEPDEMVPTSPGGKPVSEPVPDKPTDVDPRNIPHELKNK
jgi:hypothetical protein